MSVSKKLAKTEFVKVKTSTSTRIGPACDQKSRKHTSFESENVDVTEDGACR